jgi:hypothetical protein
VSDLALGDRVKDRISGFEGIITARSEYLFSGPRVYVEPCLPGDDSKLLPGEWFDIARVEAVKPAEAMGIR